MNMKMRSSYNFDYGLKIKRLLDICMSIFLIIALLPLLGVIAVLIKTTSNGPIFFWSIRVGLENAEFNMPKFRTMKINAPVIATHLFGKSGEFLTPIGSALRRASLDELPQLWSILIGDMSFVGPRPANMELIN
jgi:O-antigen biosynthesis protein WbqP